MAGMQRLFVTFSTIAIAALQSACVTNFEEVHHFASRSHDPDANRPVNYYRLTITGYAAFAKARYVSGYYDERAVDLFFNEIKSAGKSGEDIAPLFAQDLKEPGSDQKLVPLSPKSDAGALVMILSTNATVVANTIGNFAQGEVAAAAIANLVNRDVIRNARRQTATQEAQRLEAIAVEAELAAIVGQLDDSKSETMQEGARRLLNAIAGSVEPGIFFATYDDARAWFDRYDWP